MDSRKKVGLEGKKRNERKAKVKEINGKENE